jgi:hypothetical protein
MKKILLILLVAVSTSMSIVSCTEEVITPTDESTPPPTGNPTGKL